MSYVRLKVRRERGTPHHLAAHLLRILIYKQALSKGSMNIETKTISIRGKVIGLYLRLGK